MSLEPAPSFDEANQELDKSTPQEASRRSQIRIALIVLVLILLAVNLFWQSDTTAALRGRGAISGSVTNQAGRPLTGEALILGSGLRVPIAPDGTFQIENVPAGSQSLVILDAYSGYEIKVNVIAGKTVQVGALKFQVTTAPGG